MEILTQWKHSSVAAHWLHIVILWSGLKFIQRTRFWWTHNCFNMAPPHIKQSEDIVYTLYFLIICVRTMCIWYYTVMRRSMTGIRSEKCVVRRFRRPVNVIEHHSIVNTNTRTLSLVKIYYKQLKKLLHVSVYDHHQGVIMSLPKSVLFKPQLYVY